MRLRRAIAALSCACIVHVIGLAVLVARAPREARTVATHDESEIEEPVWLKLEPAEALPGNATARAPEDRLLSETRVGLVPGGRAVPGGPGLAARATQASLSARGQGVAPKDTEAPAVNGAGASASDVPSGADRTFRFQATRPGSGEPAEGQARAFGEALQRGGEQRDPAGLAKTMHDADVARGFGRGGVIARTVEDGVRADEAGAPLGKARFEVRLSSDGAVQVSLVSASDRARFAGVAQRLVARLARQKIRVGSTSSFTVTVDVDVHDQFADGTRPADVGKVSADASQGEVVQAADGTLILKKLPGVSASVRGKVCSAGVYATPLGVGFAGGCSPENIGQVARRIVTARVVKEEFN